MVCLDSTGTPIPCGGWTVYDSYVTDPRYQRYFTLGWTLFFAFVFLCALPSIIRYLISKRWMEESLLGRFGIYESRDTTYTPLSTVPAPSSSRRRLPNPFLAPLSLLRSISLFTLPLPSFLSLPRSLSFLSPTAPLAPSCHPTRRYLPFSLQTLFLVLLIPTLYLATLLPESQLRANPNRFGFLALASVPPMFVLAAKNGPIQWVLGKGWTGVNFLHRWMGRMMMLMVLLHFYFWTIQYTASNQVNEFLSGTKERRGIGALSFLLLIAMSSFGPFRRFSYPLFFTLHYLGVIGFLVMINKHTIYARNWATYVVVGVYGADIVGRLVGMRFRVVEVVAMEGGMTRIGMRNVHGGWRAGQHLSLRLFFTPSSPSFWSLFRMFEAHPFSIATAPPSLAVPSPDNPKLNRGIELFIRSCGPKTWTHDLHTTVLSYQTLARLRVERGKDEKERKWFALALVEGPYGGLGKWEEVEEETVLLVAGGSGMGFVMGVLEEVVGRRTRSGKGGRVEVVWAVRDKAQINWFHEPLLHLLSTVDAIPNLSLSLRIYLTCDTSLTIPLDSTLPTSSSSPPSPSDSILSLPHTQLIYSRPLLRSIVQETVNRALAPCGNCWPVCRCGEKEGADGVCGNDEEACAGVGVGGDEKSESSSEGGDEKKKSCCGGGGGEKDIAALSYTDKSTIPVPSSSTSPPSCCSPPSASSSTPAACGGGCCANVGVGCCSGGVEAAEGGGDEEEEGPVRVRTGGLGVVVCGPGGMMAEMRNAVAMVPLAKQNRIGGVKLHEEHFTL